MHHLTYMSAKTNTHTYVTDHNCKGVPLLLTQHNHYKRSLHSVSTLQQASSVVVEP